MADRPVHILELRSVRGTGGGPEKTILVGAARSDPRQFRVTVCYIRDARDDVFAIDTWASTLGVDYVEVRERNSFDPAIWPALRRVVRERQIDIVHSHEYKTDLLALLLAYAEGIQPLSTSHGWAGSTLKERVLYYPVGNFLLRYFPRVIAVSDPIRQRLIRAGVSASRITTILNGVDATALRRRPDLAAPARAALGIPERALVVGSVGRIEIEKRFDVLLEAVAEVRRTHPSVVAVITGKGSLETALREKAHALGLDDACMLTGHRKDVTGSYHAMDVFAQSSDTEGTPNAVLEAMAFEVPVVATAVGGTPDLANHDVHALLVPRREPAALAAAIVRTLEDPEATRQRVAAARSRVEGALSFDARMRAVEHIYSELAALRLSPPSPAHAQP